MHFELIFVCGGSSDFLLSTCAYLALHNALWRENMAPCMVGPVLSPVSPDSVCLHANATALITGVSLGPLHCTLKSSFPSFNVTLHTQEAEVCWAW